MLSTSVLLYLVHLYATEITRDLCRLVLDLSLLSPFKSSMDVTLVVTYDVSRLYMLDGLCLSWGGPISASVYQVRSYLGQTTQVFANSAWR